MMYYVIGFSSIGILSYLGSYLITNDHVITGGMCLITMFHVIGHMMRKERDR